MEKNRKKQKKLFLIYRYTIKQYMYMYIKLTITIVLQKQYMSSTGDVTKPPPTPSLFFPPEKLAWYRSLFRGKKRPRISLISLEFSPRQ